MSIRFRRADPRYNARTHSPADLAELGRLLREDRLHQYAHGHDWDLADILAVVAAWHERQPPLAGLIPTPRSER